MQGQIDLPETLKRLRTGDTAAQSELVEHFMPLAKRYYRKHVQRLPEDWRDTNRRDELHSQIEYDLVVAVSRLAKNSVPPEQVERCIRGELAHSLKHYLRNDSDDILPDKGDDGEPLKRVPSGSGRYDDGEFVETYDDPDATHHPDSRPRRFEQATSIECASDNEQTERNQQMTDAVLHKLARVCETPLEHNIVGLLMAGHDLDDIPKSLHGHTKKQIIHIITHLWQRADCPR